MAEAVAVIGAGMAGAACADVLVRGGRRVEVFDKGRSVGGRLAQRRTEAGTFDHGAQFMRTRAPEFRAAVEAWHAAGLAAPWPAVATGDGIAWVGVPAMAAPVKALLAGAEVRTGHRITGIWRTPAGWSVTSDRGEVHGPFAKVAIAVPAPQAREFLESAHAEDMAASLENVVIAPCWAGLFAFPGPLPSAPEVIAGKADLGWAARHRTKPGRGLAETWTVHAGPDWSRRHLEERPAAVAPLLRGHLATALGFDPGPPVHEDAHRWRYALVERPLGATHLLSPDGTLGLCGDWCLGARVEAAWQSGVALGRALA